MVNSNKAYNKWNSRRWQVTLWALAIISFLMIYSIITQYAPEWLGIAIPLLAAIPNVYIAAETYSKSRMVKKDLPLDTTEGEKV